MAKEQLIERSKPDMVQTTRMDAKDTSARAAWRRLPDRGILLALLAAWVALFHFQGASTLGYVDTPSLFGWWLWVNTRGLDDDAARAAVTSAAAETGLPADDPVRFGVDTLLDSVLAAMP